MHPIRLAAPGDLPRMVEIYNQAILAGNATADTVPLRLEQRHEWFRQHTKDTYPIYCATSYGGVIGYLSVSPYRERPALMRSAEISYYIDYSCHGQGFGSALLVHAIEDASRIHKKIYLAIVLEGNDGSQRLLEKHGFERWGYLPEVAEFGGRTVGHLYYGRRV